MIVADIALMFCVIILSIKLSDCVNRLDLAYEDSEEFDADIGNLKQRCEGHEELIEALSKSVRELNGVVEAAVKVKEQTSVNKPDTKALVSGWDADEPEPEDSVKNHIVDICLNGTCEQKQYLIDALTLQNILLSQTQQCIYPLQPWRPGQFQSCIYPLQQTPSGAILPLWYMNRNLEDM